MPNVFTSSTNFGRKLFSMFSFVSEEAGEWGFKIIFNVACFSVYPRQDVKLALSVQVESSPTCPPNLDRREKKGEKHDENEWENNTKHEIYFNFSHKYKFDLSLVKFYHFSSLLSMNLLRYFGLKSWVSYSRTHLDALWQRAPGPLH